MNLQALFRFALLFFVHGTIERFSLNVSKDSGEQRIKSSTLFIPENECDLSVFLFMPGS